MEKELEKKNPSNLLVIYLLLRQKILEQMKMLRRKMLL